MTYTILPTKEDLETGNPEFVSKDGRISVTHCHSDTCRNISCALFQTLAQVRTKRMYIADSKDSLATYRVSPNTER